MKHGFPCFQSVLSCSTFAPGAPEWSCQVRPFADLVVSPGENNLCVAVQVVSGIGSAQTFDVPLPLPYRPVIHHYHQRYPALVPWPRSFPTALCTVQSHQNPSITRFKASMIAACVVTPVRLQCCLSNRSCSGVRRMLTWRVLTGAGCVGVGIVVSSKVVQSVG